MTTIYLVRHAEAEGNLYRRCHGAYNSLITENGYQQIIKLEKRFENVEINAVYSSDLFRTRATARAITIPKHLKLNTDIRLREINTGIWEDSPWGNLRREYPGELDRFMTCDESYHSEGSETFGQVRSRMRSVIFEIAEKHDGQTVAVFSHGMALRTVISSFLDVPIQEVPHCDNTAVTKLEVEGNNVRVIYRGDNSHLPEDISTFARQAWWRQNGGGKDVQCWFRPISFPEEETLYSTCRKEAWVTIHGSLENYDGAQFLKEAKEHHLYNDHAVMVAMHGDEIAGLIQMDFLRDADKKIGGIPFVYMMPNYRGKGFGVQLLGQAVSTYRGLGRTKLRLRCSPDNASAQHFYKKYGFYRSGAAQHSRVPLDLLDKNIAMPE